INNTGTCSNLSFSLGLRATCIAFFLFFLDTVMELLLEEEEDVEEKEDKEEDEEHISKLQFKSIVVSTIFFSILSCERTIFRFPFVFFPIILIIIIFFHFLFFFFFSYFFLFFFFCFPFYSTFFSKPIQ